MHWEWRRPTTKTTSPPRRHAEQIRALAVMIYIIVESHLLYRCILLVLHCSWLMSSATNLWTFSISLRASSVHTSAVVVADCRIKMWHFPPHSVCPPLLIFLHEQQLWLYWCFSLHRSHTTTVALDNYTAGWIWYGEANHRNITR